MRHCPNPECPETDLLGSPAEYRDEIARCPACGAELVGHSSDPPIEIQESPLKHMVCVAVFRDLGPAYVMRAAMESQGYSVFLLDEHTVSMNWQLSQAVGGVKLIVADATMAEAHEALAPIDPEIFKALPEMQLPPTPFDICPKCGSEDVARSNLVARFKALSFWMMVFAFGVPFAARRESLSCRSCGHAWKARQTA